MMRPLLFTLVVCAIAVLLAGCVGCGLANAATQPRVYYCIGGPPPVGQCCFALNEPARDTLYIGYVAPKDSTFWIVRRLGPIHFTPSPIGWPGTTVIDSATASPARTGPSGEEGK